MMNIVSNTKYCKFSTIYLIYGMYVFPSLNNKIHYIAPYISMKCKTANATFTHVMWGCRMVLKKLQMLEIEIEQDLKMCTGS